MTSRLLSQDHEVWQQFRSSWEEAGLSPIEAHRAQEPAGLRIVVDARQDFRGHAQNASRPRLSHRRRMVGCDETLGVPSRQGGRPQRGVGHRGAANRELGLQRLAPVILMNGLVSALERRLSSGNRLQQGRSLKRVRSSGRQEVLHGQQLRQRTCSRLHRFPRLSR